MRTSLLLALALALPVHAEMSPEVYRGMQESAPEAVRLRVTSVERDYTQGHTAEAQMVRARGEVLEVTRTATGLAPGKEISLRYVHDPLPEGMAGPGPIPIILRTAEYQAFLRGGEGGVYDPAARKASFRQTKAAEAAAAADDPERVGDSTGSKVPMGAAGVLLLLVLGGLAAFLRSRKPAGPAEPDPEEDMATQFRVAPVLRKPED